jgi:dihydropteroate synthase
MEREARTLVVRGRRFSLDLRTWLMGIINVTPDSFSDGGAFFDTDRAVARGLELACEGADILDIGGESTRPGSLPVPAEEELRRVLPVVQALRKKTGVLLSVDTTKASVARAVLDEGADIINDVSGLRFDPAMAPVIAPSGAGVILMHMKGTPREAGEAGIAAERTVIDPGIGFGKTGAHNLTLLNRLAELEAVGRPLCVGLSRKAFIGRILGLPPEERLEGTIAAAVLAVSHGARILRVHDVGAVAKAVRVAEAVMGADGGPTDPGSHGKDRKVRYVC